MIVLLGYVTIVIDYLLVLGQSHPNTGCWFCVFCCFDVLLDLVFQFAICLLYLFGLICTVVLLVVCCLLFIMCLNFVVCCDFVLSVYA